MKYLIVLAILFFVQNVTAVEVEQRDGKFLSMFNIVRFPNDHCDAGGSRNGTCYTKEECSNKGGTEDGSCASGYGVCCTFVVNCGVTISENNTYFESDGDEKSHCSIKVCKASEKIVQLRLDFITFAILGPSTADVSVGKTLMGALDATNTAGMASTLESRCLDDVFAISNPGGPSPPKICGYNSDTHMYVDMGEDCIDLTFQLSGTRTLDPTWNIRITQYDMNYENLAPFGCTQYFWKQDSDSDGKGTITSYNWNGGNGQHLADQNQVICIRREEDMTKICFATSEAKDISISGTQYDPTKTWCGGYKGDAAGQSNRDALIIQSLEKADGGALPYSNVCGQAGFSTNAAAVASGAIVAGVSVCTKSLPFVVRFTSDSWEGQDAAEVNGATAANSNLGFKIHYEQS